MAAEPDDLAVALERHPVAGVLGLLAAAPQGLGELVGAAAGLGALLVLLPPPHWQATARSMVALLALLIFLSGCVLIIGHAWRTRRPEIVVLACSLLIPLVAGTHDTLLFMGLIPGDTYFSAPSAMGTLLGSSFALTWRMVQGMRLIEHFNAELRLRVADARRQLAESLASQHAAALVQTRLTERMNMVRDLHDGLGPALAGVVRVHAPRWPGLHACSWTRARVVALPNHAGVPPCAQR